MRMQGLLALISRLRHLKWRHWFWPVQYLRPGGLGTHCPQGQMSNFSRWPCGHRKILAGAAAAAVAYTYCWLLYVQGRGEQWSIESVATRAEASHAQTIVVLPRRRAAALIPYLAPREAKAPTGSSRPFFSRLCVKERPLMGLTGAGRRVLSNCLLLQTPSSSALDVRGYTTTMFRGTRVATAVRKALYVKVKLHAHFDLAVS